MPNWCEGRLKIRGKQQDVVEFMKTELLKHDWETGEDKNIEFDYKYTKGYNVAEDYCNVDLWIKNSYRMFLVIDDFADWFDNNPKAEKQTWVFPFRQAWDIEPQLLTELSVKYNIDFKIFAFERGACFNRDIEIIDGELIKDDTIQYDTWEEYQWNCIDPTIGG